MIDPNETLHCCLVGKRNYILRWTDINILFHLSWYNPLKMFYNVTNLTDVLRVYECPSTQPNFLADPKRNICMLLREVLIPTAVAIVAVAEFGRDWYFYVILIHSSMSTCRHIIIECDNYVLIGF